MGKGGSSTPTPQYIPSPTEGYGGFDFEMPDFEFPTIEPFDNSEYLAKQEEQQAKFDLQEKDRELDDLFAAKFDAAGRATKEVNAQIGNEASHAKLVGADFDMTPELKQSRINNLFADYWSADNESRLQSLGGEIGFGKRKFDKNIFRGEGSGSEGALKSLKKGKKAGAKAQKGTALTNAEDALGGTTLTPLGG